MAFNDCFFEKCEIKKPSFRGLKNVMDTKKLKISVILARIKKKVKAFNLDLNSSIKSLTRGFKLITILRHKTCKRADLKTKFVRTLLTIQNGRTKKPNYKFNNAKWLF